MALNSPKWFGRQREPARTLSRDGGARGGGAHVVVVGNEKGGAGKSTVAVLVATGLMYRGFRVAVIDVDLRQQTLSRFLANRRRWLPAAGVAAPVPQEYKLAEDTVTLALTDARETLGRFETAMGMALAESDVVVIDTPGGDTPLSRAAHLQADLVITPLNDSFVDFDMLAEVDPLTLQVLRPSLYTQVVFHARKTRAAHGRSMDWVVMRNRLAPTEVRNRERFQAGLSTLAEQIGFRIGPDLRERVVYRELFPFGLTIADLTPGVRPVNVSPPRMAAREELRVLLDALDFPDRAQGSHQRSAPT